MIINKITGEVCKTARSLWEEVFHEDSIQFTDYYFEYKADKNIGYVLGQAPYDAMMYRTPYVLQIGKVRKEISYIVGVATRKECRHRGYMRKLLMHSFGEMYKEKQPFAFLMPVNPAIYEPFDFRYVYERDVWRLKEPERMVAFLETLTSDGTEKKSSKRKPSVAEVISREEMQEGVEEETENELAAAEFADSSFPEYGTDNALNGLYSVRNLRKHFPEFPIMNLLAEFANQYLKEHYNIYVYRDVAYYEMQLKESEAQNGDIYVLFEQGGMKAFFLYAREEDEIFLQEVMETEVGILDFLQKSENKKPVIMARIIHLEEMMKLVRGKENIELLIEIEDELIPENAGIYQWEITPQGSRVTKFSQGIISKECKKERKIPQISMHIRELAPNILTRIFINEIV